MSVTQVTISKLYSGITQYLTERLKQRSYVITSFSIDSPCSAEDNFLSEIFAIKFKAKISSRPGCVQQEEVEVVKLIGKSQIIEEDGNDVRRYLFNLIFTKEKHMYSDILTKMESLLGDIGHTQPSLSPKLHHFYIEDESYSCLFMDNLISQGYYIPKTHGDGVTLGECESLMRAVARFHALSLVIEGTEGVPIPQKYELQTSEFFLNNQLADAMEPVVRGSYNGVILLAEKYRPDLVPFLRWLDGEKSVWSRLCELAKPGGSSFSCLCHGDARLNNVFIKKDDISNVRLIDFQLTRYASPLTDLQYILHMGASKEFRDKYTDQVLQTYFDEFNLILNSFPSLKLLPSQEAAVRGWTMEKVKEEYEECTIYGLLISLTLLPIILMRPGDIDKSTSQMSKTEREAFWKEERKEMTFQVGSKHADVRERLFDICDEAVALIKM